MTAIGQIEKKAQNRVVKLFTETLGYRYLGDWSKREGRNIEPELLRPFLAKKYAPVLVERAIEALQKTADNGTKSLYDRNKEVYSLLRYGVNVSAGPGEQIKSVMLIDWDRPERNDFAIAEEVTVATPNPKAATPLCQRSCRLPGSDRFARRRARRRGTQRTVRGEAGNRSGGRVFEEVQGGAGASNDGPRRDVGKRAREGAAAAAADAVAVAARGG